MQSHRNPEWVSSLYMDLYHNGSDTIILPKKIYNLIWIGDIKTDSMDIAFVP